MRVSCGRGRLARSEARRAAAHLHGLHLRLDRKECQVARVENPRCQRHPLARGQEPVPVLHGGDAATLGLGSARRN